MTPPNIRKEGSAYYLPLAMGVLAATGCIQANRLDKYVIKIELSLDGGLQPIKGVLPIAIKAQVEGFKGFILLEKYAREAVVVSDLNVYGVQNLSEVIRFFTGEKTFERTIVNTRDEFFANLANHEIDFSDVKGQENVKRP